MTISLHVEPQQTPMTWESFTETKPPYSIALDGYVYGSPQFLQKPEGPYANFNHHEMVDRLATRATCGQILLVIRQGLFSTFRDEFGARANIYVNDSDEDVCTSWFLLKNHFMVQGSINPRLNRLVDIEDKLDTTGGAYPMSPDLPLLQEMAWVFDPYRRFRANGGLDRKNSQEFSQVISDVELRIMSHVMGNSTSLPLDTRYEEVLRGKNWIMVKELGAHARTALLANGVQAFITVRERLDGRYVYGIGRISQFVKNYDVPEILRRLNIEEAKKRNVESLGDDFWGGGNTIGGSPRVSGSCLTPEEVSCTVKSVTGE